MKESKSKCHKEDSESQFVEVAGFSQGFVHISRVVWLAASESFLRFTSSHKSLGPLTVTAH